MAKQPPPAEQSATLNLNEVEAQEVKEHAYATGQRVAGATDPYSGAAPYASGTATDSAESGAGLGYGPGNTPAFAPEAPQQVGGGAGLGGEGEPHGLGKAVEGLKEALGLKRD